MQDYNPYAAPESGINASRLAGVADDGRGVWRDGKTLVMLKIARLPSHCVKCNVPTTNHLKRKLSWHSSWITLTLLFNVIIYLIVALVCRKTAKIEIPLCDEHRVSRSRGILIAWIVALSGFALCFSRTMTNEPWGAVLVLLGIFMIVFGLIFGMVRANVVVPKKIDDTKVWLKKVSPLYLASLPPLPGSKDWEMQAKPKTYYEDL